MLIIESLGNLTSKRIDLKSLTLNYNQKRGYIVLKHKDLENHEKQMFFEIKSEFL